MNKQELIEQGWAIIDGFPFHRITIDGRLQTTRIGASPGHGEWRDCRVFTTSAGYKTYCIRYNKKHKNLIIHRVVAESFLENTQGKKEVNHIDGNKANNHFSNLEWVTRKENMRHASKEVAGLMKRLKGSENPWSILNEDQVSNIKNLLSLARPHKEISLMFNVSKSTISAIATGRNWGHVA